MRLNGRHGSGFRRAGLALLVCASVLASPGVRADRMAVIERVKPSIVAVGTFDSTRTPAFQFLGTGFAVGDGTTIVTNAHVVPTVLDPEGKEGLAILMRAPNNDARGQAQVVVKQAKAQKIDPTSDLALLKIEGLALPALKIAVSSGAKEGQEILFTGYPLGAVLGPYPSTHHGMISSIAPIAIPQSHAGDLNPQTIRRIAAGAFPILQLDATAYPGHSGSPVYDAETGEVVGIINMVFVKSAKESVLSQPSGITYAIPASRLQDLLKTQ